MQTATQRRVKPGIPAGGQFTATERDEADIILNEWKAVPFAGSIPVVNGELCPGSRQAAQFFFSSGDRMRHFSFDRERQFCTGTWKCFRCGGEVEVTQAQRGASWRLGVHRVPRT